MLETFYSKTYENTTDIASYVSELKNIAVKLLALGINIEDDMLVSKILSSLPQEYRHFLSAWDSTEKNQKTLENLVARLISEEMRNNCNQTEGETIAFKAISNKNKSTRVTKDCRPNDRFSNTQQGFSNKQGQASKPNNYKIKGNLKACSICKKN